MKTNSKFKMLCVACLVSLGSSSLAQNIFPGTGNVGIGTNTPSYPLHIKTGYMGLQIDGTDATWTGMYIRNTTTTGQPFYGYQSPTRSVWHYLKANGNWALYNGGDRLVVTPTGNFGVGTASPVHRLHIVGSGASNIDLRVNGRIHTGDANNSGGVWLNNGATQFVGQYNANMLGLWNNGWRFLVNNNGNVLINKTSQVNTAYKLDVNGSVRANEIVVNTTGADFVFEDNYKLRPLSEVEAFIKENKHLPEVPPAAEMSEEGMKVAELSTTLLQKVEELTLYMIELKKENDALKAKVDALENE